MDRVGHLSRGGTVDILRKIGGSGSSPLTATRLLFTFFHLIERDTIYILDGFFRELVRYPDSHRPGVLVHFPGQPPKCVADPEYHD